MPAPGPGSAGGMEEGEAVDEDGAGAGGGEDDAAMMAMMGMAGFGTTKVGVFFPSSTHSPSRLRSATSAW
jgi:hypothetical protein